MTSSFTTQKLLHLGQVSNVIKATFSSTCSFINSFTISPNFKKGLCFAKVESYLVNIAQASKISTWLLQRDISWIYKACAYITSISNSNKSPCRPQKAWLTWEEWQSCVQDTCADESRKPSTFFSPGRHEKNKLSVSPARPRGAKVDEGG